MPGASPTLVSVNQLTAAYRIDPVLHTIDWHWQRGQQWAFVGGNGAGKTALVNALTGALPPQSGSVSWANDIDVARDVMVVSFDLQRQLVDHDLRFDDSELREDAFDVGTTVAAVVLGGRPRDAQFEALAQRCHIDHILERGIRFVSTGESRKTLLARALLRAPKVLILDNPLEGLDARSQAELRALIEDLQKSELAVLLLLQQAVEVGPGVSHILHLREGAVAHSGARAEVLPLLTPASAAVATLGDLPPPLPRTFEADGTKPLLQLRSVNVHYGEQPILTDLNWRMDWGQHWWICGPNGAGKSTLLSLLCGDNHKAYGQEVELFGRRRGSGESVWDIKARFGVVSTALHMQQPLRQRLAEVIASGLYDSVGLYQTCSGRERDIALQWLQLLGLEALAKRPLGQLSFGQQRLALLARAMVKSPLILILDEPCIGLDDEHRAQILTLVDRIAAQGSTHILYVSHSAGERPASISHQLQLQPHAAGGYTAFCSAL